MSTYHCEKPVPHVHDFDYAKRSDGRVPQIGDVVQCECGKYARYRAGDYGSWWCTTFAWYARYLVRRCQP